MSAPKGRGAAWTDAPKGRGAAWTDAPKGRGAAWTDAPKGRGAAWTEERGARNERRATREGGAVKGNGEVGGAPEAQRTQRALFRRLLPLGGEASRVQGADNVLGAKAARLGRACAA